MKVQSETATGFLKHSREFLIAAELVLNRASNVSLPGYFLLGRSIELSLKAYLLASGMSVKELASRKYGHNLSSIFAEACKRGILSQVSIDSIESGVLALLNFDYATKRLEYRITDGIYYLPRIDITEEIARKLVGGLEDYCATTTVRRDA